MDTFPHVLALSPHTDDAEVAAGATLARLNEEGSDTTIIAFSYCENRALKTAFKRAAKTLGAQSLLLDYPRRLFHKYRQEILDNLCEYYPKPDLVLLPYSHDYHQDHTIIHHEAIRAFRRTSTLWGYMHTWNNPATPTLYVPITLNHFKTKIKALKHYLPHLPHKPHFHYNMQHALLSIYGLPVKQPLAEPFQVIRWIL